MHFIMNPTFSVALPKVGIRPTIDGRLGGVRESLEKLTLAQAKQVADLISDKLNYPNGFRPSAWNAFGTKDLESADFRACENFGPLYR